MANWFELACIALVVISFLILFCGNWPIFEGTLVQSAHNCCTGGSFELLEKIAGFFCGDLGRRAVVSCEYYCCERSNPILQIFYFLILGGTYFAIVKTSFGYIPGYYVSGMHRYLGTFGVIVAALLFLMTSFSDPGKITAANVSDFVSMYPYDGILYEEKTCRTCGLVRPARSKHCSICGRCIARFDHHCGWTNTCIGENNTRFFIMFLLWNCCLTLYGTFLIGAILAGEVKKRHLVRLLSVYFGVDLSFWKLLPHIIRWLTAFYSEQLLILLFLTAISLLLMGFLSYHLYLIITNTTTNETFKWENYKRWRRNVALESHYETQENRHATDKVASEPVLKRLQHFCCMSLFSRKINIQEDETLKRKNIYNKGFVGNISEVLFPRSCQLWYRKFRFTKDKKS